MEYVHARMIERDYQNVSTSSAARGQPRRSSNQGRTSSKPYTPKKPEEAAR